MYINKQMSSRRLHIDIRENGLYSFDDQTATGKTYLVNLMQGMNEVYVVTYSSTESVLNAQIDEALSDKYKLVIFDRCDLYMTQNLYDKLLSKSNDMIILLDLKNFYEFTNVAPWPVQVILRDEEIFVI